MVAGVRRDIAALVRRRIERDVALGLLAADTDAPALAQLAIGVIQGMSVLARDGIGRAGLLGVAAQAVHAFRAGPACLLADG